jgi:hypothetical protein
MPYMLINFDADYDEWKQAFDADPAGRAQSAKGYAISRAVDDLRDIYVRVEFASTDEAKAFRQRLLDSGVLGRFTVKSGPTVVDVAESATY